MNATQTFLDAGQYASDEIAHYEAIFGRNFVSAGGPSSTEAILKMVDFTPDMTVLDIGCGLGGAAFMMAQTYGVTVHGLDLSQNMIHTAKERCAEAGLSDKVQFFHGNCLDFDFSTIYNPPIYDIVHSRDTFLHIGDKRALFSVIWDLLKPDGTLLFTDYCRGEDEPSPQFAAYIEQRQYDLHTPAAYGRILEQSGFQNVQALDKTDWFIQIMQDELLNIQTEKLDQETIDALCQSWQAKIARAQQGEQRWGLFMATKSG